MVALLEAGTKHCLYARRTITRSGLSQSRVVSLRGAVFAPKQSPSGSEIASQRTLAMTEDYFGKALSPGQGVLPDIDERSIIWIENAATRLSCPFGVLQITTHYKEVMLGTISPGKFKRLEREQEICCSDATHSISGGQ